MNLLEHEAKQLLDRAGIPIPRGVLITQEDSLPNIALPTVLKSQVPTGGRGKLAGIRIVTTESELLRQSKELFHHLIHGYLPSAILCEEVISISDEFYLALAINRSTASIELIAHRQGGIDIESHDQGELFRRQLNQDTTSSIGEVLGDAIELPDHSFRLQDMIEKLYRCFVDNDALLIEINPLILTKSGALVAGDCKMILDDAASFRHPEWDFHEQPTSNNFVTLDPHGTVATMANGAGLAMATVDAVTSAGLVPANFLDIGGNASTPGIVDSFRQITAFPHVRDIIINIFGGIVRCDDVARAIIEARGTFPDLPELHIRLSGTNAAIAAELLADADLPLYENLDDCIGAIQS